MDKDMSYEEYREAHLKPSERSFEYRLQSLLCEVHQLHEEVRKLRNMIETRVKEGIKIYLPEEAISDIRELLDKKKPILPYLKQEAFKAMAFIEKHKDQYEKNIDISVQDVLKQFIKQLAEQFIEDTSYLYDMVDHDFKMEIRRED